MISDVCVCVCPHDKTKTTETTIINLVTMSPCPSINMVSKGQRSQGHKWKKNILKAVEWLAITESNAYGTLLLYVVQLNIDYDVPSDKDETDTEDGKTDGECNDEHNCYRKSCNINITPAHEHSTHNRAFRRRAFPANHLATVLTK